MDDCETLSFYSMGYYVQCLYNMFNDKDVRRKDFTALVIHHVFCIALCQYSLITKTHLVTQLGIYFHELTDILLELSKILNYLNKYNVVQVTYASFAFSWTISRLYWYPTIVSPPRFACRALINDFFIITGHDMNSGLLAIVCNDADPGTTTPIHSVIRDFGESIRHTRRILVLFCGAIILQGYH